MDLSLLEKAAAVCVACELCKNRYRPVFARGHNCLGLMVVGMVPGPEENKIGKPFVGPAGHLLDDIFIGLDTSSEDVYITNLVKCALQPGVPLKISWIDSCLPFLISQIYLIGPKIILTLGADAANVLIGRDLNAPLSSIRGRIIKYTDDLYLIPTYHPSYLLRGGGKQHRHYNLVVKDFQNALEIAETEMKRAKIGGL